jgi:formate--tetrahydrofolate ligase
VAINRFTSDSDAEVNAVREFCEGAGVLVSEADVWGKGGGGALDLADKVVEACSRTEGAVRPLYEWTWDVSKKIETVARKIYGANAIDFTSQARKDLVKIKNLGLDGLPVCIAKTQKSLSDNPKLLGRPKDFIVTVRRIEIASGAGFLIPITGDIMRMPGLPAVPAAEQIDIDDEGTISGLF